MKRLFALLGATLSIWAAEKPPLNFVTLNSGTQSNLTSIAIGGGSYVAVGAGVAIRSSDGINWSPTAPSWSAPFGGRIIYANNKFVAAGNKILSSDDGANWTEATMTPTSSFFVSGGNGMFVATDFSNAIFWSTNAIDWTKVSAPTNGLWSLNSTAFGNGLFLAAGWYRLNSLVAVATCFSTNGINWSFQTEVGTAPLQADMWTLVTFGQGRFFEKTSAPWRASTDGKNWTAWTNVLHISDLQFLNGRAVAIPQPNFGPTAVVHIARGDLFDQYDLGFTNKLAGMATDSAEYFFVGSAGKIVKTQGALPPPRIDVQSFTPPTLQLMVSGAAAFTYQLQQASADQGMSPTSFTNIGNSFVMPGNVTNVTVPFETSGPGAFFRITEK